MVAANCPLMPPENETRTSAPPAMMNQVLTSWLLTTSPRLSASSRRFCVGSSVFSELSVSSATRLALRQLAEHALHIADECAHHATDHQHKQQQAKQDR